MFFFPRRILLFSSFVCSLALSSSLSAAQPSAPRVEGIRFWSFGDVTRIAVETSGDYKLYSEQIENPTRIYFDLVGLQAPSAAQHGMQVIQVNDHRLRQIRVAKVNSGKTRIVFDVECPVEIVSSQLVNPDRLMIEIRPKGTSLPALSASRSVTGAQKVDLSSHLTEADSDVTDPSIKSKPSGQKVLQSLGSPQAEPAKGQLAQAPDKQNTASQDNDPNAAYRPRRDHAAVSVPPLETVPETTVVPPAPQSPVTAITAAKSDSTGDRSLVRVFGLKLGRVVIDAGHGGHDSGTVGPNGLMEKDLVLDVALRLGALITKQLGAEVVYTRSSDIFIPLEERTKIANDHKADLFISVHANSSAEPAATGVETYYFNLNSDKVGLDLATRENASAGSSISDLNDLLHRAVLQTKLEESREFAQKVQASLIANSAKSSVKVRDRGVRQAPFVVLIGATMPSILAEIGFVSNPHDERLLRRNDTRQHIAEALMKGVLQYANSLSHSQMARAKSE
jgi:N-acetylmuramoyl-L-alanine amidase